MVTRRGEESFRKTLNETGKSCAALFAELELDLLSVSGVEERGKEEEEEEEEEEKCDTSEEHMKKTEIFFTDNGSDKELRQRAMSALAWSEEKTQNVFAAYKKYIFLKSKVNDFDVPSILSPPVLIDQLWNLHWSDTPSYHRSCMRAFGRIMHNDSASTDHSCQARTKSEFMQAFPEDNFDQDPIWSDFSTSSHGNKSTASSHDEASNLRQHFKGLSIKVKVVASNEELFFKLNTTTLFSKVFSCCAARFGLPLSTTRFLYRRVKLEGDQTPLEFDMQDGDQIDLVIDPPCEQHFNEELRRQAAAESSGP